MVNVADAKVENVEKGQRPVGNADLYTSIVGLCADVNAYEQAHGSRSNSCW
jgi:hypothetical protein